MGKKNNNVSKETMENDFLALIEILKKYANENDENAKNYKTIKETIRRFKQLSEDGQKIVIGKLIYHVQMSNYSTLCQVCREKGHRYSKWEELNWTKSHFTYERFVESYGAPTVWSRACEVCGDRQTETTMPNCIRHARERAARKERILRLESELETLKKQDRKKK